MKNVAWTLVPGPFSFQRIICKKKSEEASMLIWTNFDSFAIKYLISRLLQKFHFPTEVVFNSLETQMGLELVFIFFVEYFDEIISFGI